MSVITSLTIQNTLGVRAISDSIPEFFKEQIAAIFEDIFPDSLKISMVLSIAIASNLTKGYTLKNPTEFRQRKWTFGSYVVML